ncbi:MAG: SpoIIE family protein phosphatase [Actinomycetota bacterium]
MDEPSSPPHEKLLEALGDAFLTTDLDDRVVYLNQEAARLLCVERAAVDGVPLQQWCPEELCGVIVDLRAPAAREQAARPFRIHAPSIGRWLEGYVAATNEGTAVLVRDVTERTLLEQRTLAEHAVARVLAEVSSLEEAAPRILESVCDSLDWAFGAIWKVDNDLQELRLVALSDVTGSAGDFAQLTHEMTFRRGVGLPGRVWASGAPVWITDIAASGTFPRAPAAATAGLHAGAGFPLRVGREIHGVMEFFSPDIRPLDEGLLGMMEAVGSQVGQFIARARAQEAVRHSEARRAAVLQSALDAVVMMDHEGNVVDCNPAAEEMFGRRRADLLGMSMAELLVPKRHRRAHHEGVARHLTTGLSKILGRRLELSALHEDGSEFPVELAVVRVDLPGPPVFTGYIRDITKRKRAEAERAQLLAQARYAQEEAESAQRRLAFLAEASRMLSSSLDFSVTLKNLASLIVPSLAEWCVVHVVSNGSIGRAAVAHEDPSRHGLLEEIQRQHRSMVPTDRHPVGRVIRTGRSELVPELPEALLASLAKSDDAFELFGRLGIRSYMCVPLADRGRILGALSLGTSDPGRRFTERDLGFVEVLAQRAAVAVENARLYEETAHVAHTLQQSLLPADLPRIPGVELAARYHFAGEGAEIGGDFYDVFRIGRRRWMLLMGDVCGKGVEAGSLTALVRYTLRALAMQVRQPSEMLGMLNEALRRQLTDDRFCTVVAARLDRTHQDARLTLSCGGHPSPLVLRAEGAVEAAGQNGTLLGLFPDPRLSDQTIALHPGDAVVFYTDGVTDARGPGGMVGYNRLVSVIASCAGLDADGIADRLEAEVLKWETDRPRDDLAILVLRIAK